MIDSYYSPRAGITLLFNLSIRWALVANIAPQLLTFKKEPWYPLNRRVGGLQCQCG